MSIPFNRKLGTVITIHNEPLVTKKDRTHILCSVENTKVNIPLSFFKNNNLPNLLALGLKDNFTTAIYSTENDVQLHQLLQGKTVQIISKRNIQDKGIVNAFIIY